MSHPKDRLVQIAVAPNEIIAALWKGWLEEEGIRALVKLGGPGPAYHGSFAVEQYLYVLESDAERAREILSDTGDEVD